ncbi:Sua5 YciO YrdC YwlC family protein [Nitratifractor sp.]|uniref:Sua5 YciO YrdC YwlC family protein n=1 Tax=Nitratifractor sp. TaxID=2268144 RepID=UPI0025CE59A8|nr:Sua5 YciO YrdC YwlC family protein [Nitratifractor sp.]
MSLEHLLFLSDTDTTVGFISKDARRIDRAKQRPPSKHYITALPSLRSLTTLTRIPRSHRRRIRRRRHESYILPSGHSYRIVHNARHLLLLKRLGRAYTSSANLSDAPYEEAYARQAADVIVEPLGPPRAPSRIYRLGRQKMKRLR